MSGLRWQKWQRDGSAQEEEIEPRQEEQLGLGRGHVVREKSADRSVRYCRCTGLVTAVWRESTQEALEKTVSLCMS